MALDVLQCVCVCVFPLIREFLSGLILGENPPAAEYISI